MALLVKISWMVSFSHLQFSGQFFYSIFFKGVIELPRSGRVIRTLNGSTPSHLRTFSPVKLESGREHHKLSNKQLGAELLHIYRPLTHLSSMYFCGTQSWIPWVFSLGIDLTR